MPIYRVSRYDSTEGHQGYCFFRTKREAIVDAATWRRESAELAIADLPECAEPAIRKELVHRYTHDHFKTEIDTIEMPKNKADLLCLLGWTATHADNG